MRKLIPYALAATLLATVTPALHAQMVEPPPANFKKVSTLVQLPDFLPGIGRLYVDPSTLPVGPFLAYDRQGHLVSSIYMVPLDSMNAHANWNNLGVAQEKVDHVDIVFNAGHPGVAMPHYHVVLWYVSREQAGRVQ